MDKIEQKFIYVDSKSFITSNADFSTKIPYKSIVFIGDTGELYSHGKYFGNLLEGHNSTYFALANHTHSYSNLTGSTTTENLVITSSGVINGWTLKTLGSGAFADVDDYLPISGGTLDFGTDGGLVLTSQYDWWGKDTNNVYPTLTLEIDPSEIVFHTMSTLARSYMYDICCVNTAKYLSGYGFGCYLNLIIASYLGGYGKFNNIRRALVAWNDDLHFSSTYYNGFTSGGIPTINIVGTKVGINVLNPSYTLDVVGNIESQKEIRILGENTLGDSYLEFWRGTNPSWKLINTEGYLKFQSNWTTYVGSYFDCAKLDYNTGNFWTKGNITATGTLNSNTGTYDKGNRVYSYINNNIGTGTTNYSAGNHTHSNYFDSTTSRTANTVLAAPNGSSGVASFRNLVATDIPTLNLDTTGNANTATMLKNYDSRNTDIAPFSTMCKGGMTGPHLKYNTTDGLSDGGVFHASLFISDWNDPIGGNSFNLAFTDNGNMWLRNGSTTWGSWLKFYNSTNSNLTTIDWSVQNLIANGTISGVTTLTLSSLLGTNNATTEYYHRLDIGKTDVNYWSFYEYGGDYRFYKCTSGVSTDVSLICQITNSNILANGFKVNGGTASSFLKADGTLDSTSYLPLTGGTMSGSILSGTLYPTANNSYDLGTSSYKYRHIYANYLGSSSYYINQAYITVLLTGKIIPKTSLTYTLGNSSYYWNGTYSNGFYKSGSSDSYVLLGGGGHKAITDFCSPIDVSYDLQREVGWRLVLTADLTSGWMNFRWLLGISSRHCGTGILSIGVDTNNTNADVDFDIKFLGSVLSKRDYFKFYHDTANNLFKIFVNMNDYAGIRMTLLNAYGSANDYLPTTGTFYSSLPSITGTELSCEYNYSNTYLPLTGGTVSGNITATAFYLSSDFNLKENISSIKNVYKIGNIDFKQFNFKNNNILKYGVIAQDLEKEGLNNLISEDNNGNKSVDYISLLVLEIQRLREEIKNIKSEMTFM